MKLLLVFVLCFSLAFSVNHHGLTITQIAQQLVQKVDTNNDGILSEAELDHEILTNHDHDGDGCATEHEFTHQWNKEYHDDHHAAQTFFSHLDIDHNGCLRIDDLAVHAQAMDEDKDGQISEAEFTKWLNQVHPDRVHGHGR